MRSGWDGERRAAWSNECGQHGSLTQRCVLTLPSHSISFLTQSLDVELVRRGPRETDAPGSVPPARFAHTAVAVPWAGAAAAAQGAHAGAGSGEGAAAAAGAASGGQQQAAGQVAMVVFGGVNPAEDLADVAIWVDG